MNTTNGVKITDTARMRQDFNMPQKLANGIYWLGMRRNVRLETNTYLLLLKASGRPSGTNMGRGLAALR